MIAFSNAITPVGPERIGKSGSSRTRAVSSTSDTQSEVGSKIKDAMNPVCSKPDLESKFYCRVQNDNAYA